MPNFCSVKIAPTSLIFLHFSDQIKLILYPCFRNSTTHLTLVYYTYYLYRFLSFFFAENVAEEPVIRRRKASAALDDMDDFEMISEEELAEVSP